MTGRSHARLNLPHLARSLLLQETEGVLDAAASGVNLHDQPIFIVPQNVERASERAERRCVCVCRDTLTTPPSRRDLPPSHLTPASVPYPLRLHYSKMVLCGLGNRKFHVLSLQVKRILTNQSICFTCFTFPALLNDVCRRIPRKQTRRERST